METPLSELSRRILDLFEAERLGELPAVLSDEHPSDIAEVINILDEEQRPVVFRAVPARSAPEVLSNVHDATLTSLLAGLTDQEISAAVDELPSDDAVDIIGELDDEDQNRVLDLLEDEDKEALQVLLEYDEESAGGIMESEFVAVREGVNVRETVDELRRHAEEVERVHNVYSVDGHGRLSGILELWRLTISEDDRPVAPLIDREFHSVPVDMDQEEVAALAMRYDLVEVPVVDAAGLLVGRITFDDVLDVIEEEATEDISKMAGTAEEDVHEESVLRVTWLRFPWLLVGLCGGVVSALIMSRFEIQLERLITLAFFVPVIMAMGGSVGIQCSTVVVRSLALGELEEYRMQKRLVRELLVALVNGVLLATILSITAMFWHGSGTLAVILGIAMFLSILVAATAGTVVPMGLKRMGFDPALATGPFITTTNDVLNLLIYFAVASLLLARL